MSRRTDSNLWIRFATSVLGDGGGGQPLMPPSSSRTSSLFGQYRVDLSKLDYLFFVYSSSYCLSRSAPVLAPVHRFFFKFRVSFHMSELSAYGAHHFYYLSRTYRARPYVFITVNLIVYRQSLVSPVHRFPVSSANAARHLRGRQAQSRTLMVHTIGPTVRIRSWFGVTTLEPRAAPRQAHVKI